MREPSDGLSELDPEQLRNMVRRYKVRSSQLEADLTSAKEERYTLLRTVKVLRTAMRQVLEATESEADDAV